MHKEKIIVCDKCNWNFNLESAEIKETSFLFNNKMYDLVYFVCPSCDEVYRILIRDKRFYELQEDLEKAKSRLNRTYQTGNAVLREKFYSIVLKKKQRLEEHVLKTNKLFSGNFVYECSDNVDNIKYLP